jgi:hypothetical protein
MSMFMAERGHIIHAMSMFGQTFHLAWGGLPEDYKDPWSISDVPPLSSSTLRTATVTRGQTGWSDALPDTDIVKIVSVKQGGTTLTNSTQVNNTIDWTAANAAAPESVPARGSTYTVVYRYLEYNLLALEMEFGRLPPTELSYVNQDLNGDIVANGTNWSRSETPTRNLYLLFKFDGLCEVGKVIYQLGLWVGTQKKPGVLPGQLYLVQADILQAGTMYMMDNITPFVRVSGKREMFEFVVTY